MCKLDKTLLSSARGGGEEVGMVKAEHDAVMDDFADIDVRRCLFIFTPRGVMVYQFEP
jgi:hypothetical protein